jgi:aryl-alcohol dehydrogenase-like predicted oxidoreductase
MRYVKLGKTGMEVSVIALGTWAFGGEWGAFDEGEARDAIHCALDLGVTLFDTAQAYGFGRAEHLLAGALGAHARRGDVFVATKGGLRRSGDGLVRDASAHWLRQGVEASLRNLDVETIDLYQVHWPDGRTPPEETAEELEELVREGKIRHVGVSNYDVQQMDDMAAHGYVETDQPPYHLFRRDIEAEILPYATANDIGVLVYGPLAHGLLSGRMDAATTTFADDDWRHGSPDFSGETFRRNLSVVERLRVFGADRGLSLPTLAVAWSISHPAVHAAIVGARRPAHLDDLVAAADVSLSASDLDEIDRIVADASPVRGPSPEGM